MEQVRLLPAEFAANRRRLGLEIRPNSRVVILGPKKSGASTFALHLLGALGGMRLGAVGFDRASCKGLGELWNHVRPVVQESESDAATSLPTPNFWPAVVPLNQVREALARDWEKRSNESKLADLIQVIDLSRSWSATDELIRTAAEVVFTLGNGVDPLDQRRFISVFQQLGERRDQRRMVVYSATRMLPVSVSREQVAETYGVPVERVFLIPNFPEMSQAMRDGYLAWSYPGANAEEISPVIAELWGGVMTIVRSLGESRRRPEEFFREMVERLLQPSQPAGVPLNQRDRREYAEESQRREQHVRVVAAVRHYISVNNFVDGLEADDPGATAATKPDASVSRWSTFTRRHESKQSIRVRIGVEDVAILDAIAKQVPADRSALMTMMIAKVFRVAKERGNLTALVPVPANKNLAERTSFALDRVSCERLDQLAQFVSRRGDSTCSPSSARDAELHDPLAETDPTERENRSGETPSQTHSTKADARKRSRTIRWVLRVFAAVEGISVPSLRAGNRHGESDGR